MRVLHLIDPAGGCAGPCVLRLVADALVRITDAAHEVVLVGHRSHLRQARRCGLSAGAVHAPLGRAQFAVNTLRGYTRASRQADIVHAWSWTAATLAARALPDRPLIVSPFTGLAPARRTLARLRRRGSIVQVLVGDDAYRQACEMAGCRADTVAVLPPAVDPSHLAPSMRGAIRTRWNVDETDFVIGLLGEPAHTAEGWNAGQAAGRTTMSCRSVQVVMHPKATGRSETLTHYRNIRQVRTLVTDPLVLEPWTIVNGLDAALVIGAAGAVPPVLPALWAMAAGLPVVADRTPGLETVVGDGRAGWLTPSGDLHAVTDRVLDLFDDAESARRLGERGRSLVGEWYGADRFAERLSAAYEQVAHGEYVRFQESDEATKRRSDEGKKEPEPMSLTTDN